MDSRLNSIGAALLGLVTVALAVLWSRQERHTMEILRSLLHECEERNETLNEQMVRVYEQYHKAISNVTYAETMNYQYSDRHNQDKRQIYELKAENDALSREIDQLRAAQVGRALTREDDER
jgi:hypothetical protein